MWNANLLGQEQESGFNCSFLRILRYLLEATLDRSLTTDYLARNIRCTLGLAGNALALTFDDAVPVALNCLSIA
jgi:hypothetical protein